MRSKRLQQLYSNWPTAIILEMQTAVSHPGGCRKDAANSRQLSPQQHGIYLGPHETVQAFDPLRSPLMWTIWLMILSSLIQFENEETAHKFHYFSERANQRVIWNRNDAHPSIGTSIYQRLEYEWKRRTLKVLHVFHCPTNDNKTYIAIRRHFVEF